MTGKKDATIYLAGVPTAPDVAALMKHFPQDEMPIGRNISYEEISSVIGVSQNTCRFKTVVWKWRKEFREETGKVLGAPLRNKTLQVLDAPETARVSRAYHRRAVSATKSSIEIGGLVDISKLNPEEKKQLDYVLQKSGQILAAIQIKGKRRPPRLLE